MEPELLALNRTLLARQLLLERARLPVTRAVERLCALQAQYVPSPYVALWSRLEGFRREQLTRALARGSVVQHGSVRGTLHLTTRAEFPFFAAAYVEPQRARARRRGIDLARLRTAVAGADDVDAAALEALGSDDPWDAAFALRALPRIRLHAAAAWGSPPGGRSTLWREPLPDTAKGTALAVRSYLAAFGPATRKDVEHFLALPVAQLKPALEPFRAGDGLYDVARGRTAPAGTPAPPRFLHSYDSAFLAHHDKSRLCAPEYVDVVYRKANSTMQPVFLVDGFVAGTWKVERAKTKATLVVSAFERLTRSALREVRAEAGRLVRWYADDATSFAVRA